MPKTKTDIVAHAHRMLGLLAADEVPTADMDAFAGTTLDGVLEEMHYGVAGPVRSRAIGRVRAHLAPDDR